MKCVPSSWRRKQLNTNTYTYIGDLPKQNEDEYEDKIEYEVFQLNEENANINRYVSEKLKLKLKRYCNVCVGNYLCIYIRIITTEKI